MDNISDSSSSSSDSSDEEEVDKLTPKYSTKVFMGGLPHGGTVQSLISTFNRFGELRVDWPQKPYAVESYPKKGFAFLLYRNAASVDRLIAACIKNNGKLFYTVPSPKNGSKLIEIRPWCHADAKFVYHRKMREDTSNIVFLCGVPRSLKAKELGDLMCSTFGAVHTVTINIDRAQKCPKGSAQVSFIERKSYIDALTTRFVDMRYDDYKRTVEVKPNVLSGQMCYHCMAENGEAYLAPYFCGNVKCLTYYCESCWTKVHAFSGCPDNVPVLRGSLGRASIRPFHQRSLPPNRM